MKNTLTLLLLIIVFLLPVHASVAAEQKIATINVGKAFKGYWRTAVEDKRLKNEVEEVKTRVSREEKRLQELVTELENMKKVLSNPNMNQVERARRTKQFTDKQRALTGISKQLNLWKKSVDKDLVEKDRKATEKIRGEILE